MNDITRISMVDAHAEAVIAISREHEALLASCTTLALEDQAYDRISEVIRRQSRTVNDLVERATPKSIEDVRSLARAALELWERDAYGVLEVSQDWQKIASMICAFLAAKREQIWTTSRRAYLTEAWSRGDKASEIGRHLGFSKNAVIGQARRMDLGRRPSPIRRPTQSMSTPMEHAQ